MPPSSAFTLMVNILGVVASGLMVNLPSLMVAFTPLAVLVMVKEGDR